MPAKSAKSKLVEAALAARTHAKARWSRFRVGAALMDSNGGITSGANVESASYGLTCCAERVALFKALTEGRNGFSAMAVAADSPGGPTPCGACRQLLAEYAPGALIYCVDSRAPIRARKFRIEELLPLAFTGASLVPAPKGKLS